MKVNSTYSSLLKTKIGVPQGSILGPLFFNIFLNDLLFITGNNVCNYADDNTIYVESSNLKTIKDSLQNSLKCVSEWFKTNYFILNLSKCQFLLLCHRNVIQEFHLEVGGIIVKPSEKVEF